MTRRLALIALGAGIAAAFLSRNPEPTKCAYCDGSGQALRYGAGPYADLISCPMCGTGEKLADTLYPATWAA